MPKAQRVTVKPLRTIKAAYPAPPSSTAAARKRRFVKPASPVEPSSTTTLVAPATPATPAPAPAPIVSSTKRAQPPKWLKVTTLYLKLARIVRAKGDQGRCPENVLVNELVWRDLQLPVIRTLITTLVSHGLLELCQERGKPHGGSPKKTSNGFSRAYRLPEHETPRYKPY